MLIKNKPISKATHVAFVLDASGSMEPIKNRTIELFNSQLNLHKKAAEDGSGGNVTFSFYSFNDKVTTLCKGESLQNISGDLTSEEYTCSGTTALNDGIIKAIDDLTSLPVAGNQAYLVIILSDGEENASKYRDTAKLKARISELTGTEKWTFEFIGSDGLGITHAAFLGFNTKKFAATPKGVQNLSGSLNAGVESYYSARACGSTNHNLFNSEDIDQEKS